MTLATTRTKIQTVIDAVTGVDNVYVASLTKTRRADAEAARGVADATDLQSWEIVASPEVLHGGADGYRHTELDVEVVAHWVHTEASDSLGTFLAKLEAVMDALADPANFPQLDVEGVRMRERPDMPVKLPTGQSAYRARLAFRLLDVEST